jgi:hypothetical protein
MAGNNSPAKEQRATLERMFKELMRRLATRLTERVKGLCGWAIHRQLRVVGLKKQSPSLILPHLLDDS